MAVVPKPALYVESARVFGNDFDLAEECFAYVRRKRFGEAKAFPVAGRENRVRRETVNPGVADFGSDDGQGFACPVERGGQVVQRPADNFGVWMGVAQIVQKSFHGLK